MSPLGSLNNLTSTQLTAVPPLSLLEQPIVPLISPPNSPHGTSLRNQREQLKRKVDQVSLDSGNASV